MGPELVYKYFPDFSALQKEQISRLHDIYSEWNQKINVISRKDIDQLYLRHVLHSLSIAKFIRFEPGAEIMDVGTGGGFPGIPLAIAFPEAHFHLVDSVGKKIRVVEEVARTIRLGNVTTEHNRAEKAKGKFDFVVSRAVAKTETLFIWMHQKLKPENCHSIHNGFLFLKGGDLTGELTALKRPYRSVSISDYFDDAFFETKKIIYIGSEGSE